jgi:hypothetical protein
MTDPRHSARILRRDWVPEGERLVPRRRPQPDEPPAVALPPAPVGWRWPAWVRRVLLALGVVG